MKTNILLSAAALLAASICVGAAPKDEVTAAIKKLADQPNYTWTSTVVVPDGSRGRSGPTEGKTEKDGFTYVKSQFGERTSETVVKGEKGAVTNQDGAWESLDEVENQEGFGRFRAAMARNLKAPAAQAEDIVAGTKELKKEGDAYSGELTEAAVKQLMSFGGRRGGGGGEGPEVSNAKGTAKFWVKNGMLSKYEFDVKGTMSFNNNDREIDRKTTVEIKDVGTTKVNIPEQAKKKAS
jgi:hypothetical protein